MAERPDVVLDADQRAILTLMGERPVQPELLATHLGWGLDRCCGCLASLEISGRVKKTFTGYQASR